ncbi:hypothetical protein GCM10028808_30880 [Spirosoma migulaei]
MNNNLLKSILAGLLVGVALFIMPFFLIRLVFFVLIIGALLRIFGGGRFRRGWRQGPGYGQMPAFADRIRQMSDEEYNQFKQRFNQGGRYGDYETRKATDKPTNETTL